MRALRDHPNLEWLGCSRLYGSLPVGPSQPNYVNAAVAVRTELDPLALLDVLQAQEAAQLRRRDGERWVARTLDLDLLLYGDAVIDLARLQVPHPRLTEREFALRPLNDVCPECIVAGTGESVATHLARQPQDMDAVWLLD